MPSPPAFGDDDYATALAKLMPSGRAWRKDWGAMFSAALRALSPTYTRSTEAAAQLLIDADPATTENLLAEWEESLGLPDGCTPANPTIAQRQAAVRAKFAARGTLTTEYFVKLAAGLGYAITITEFAASTFGQPFGLPMYGSAWAFVWQVNAPTFTVEPQTFGSPFGEPFASWGNTELQCRILANAPAGTIVLFNYS